MNEGPCWQDKNYTSCRIPMRPILPILLANFEWLWPYRYIKYQSITQNYRHHWANCIKNIFKMYAMHSDVNQAPQTVKSTFQLFLSKLNLTQINTKTLDIKFCTIRASFHFRVRSISVTDLIKYVRFKQIESCDQNLMNKCCSLLRVSIIISRSNQGLPRTITFETEILDTTAKVSIFVGRWNEYPHATMVMK